MERNLEIVAPARPATLAEEVTELFLSYRAPLLRYLLSMGLPVAVGEEVVQEVFLALFQHLRQGKPRENLRGWIFRVGHNLGLKQRLRAVRRPQVSLDEQRPCGGPNPEQAAAASEGQRRILAVVQAMPAQDQYCLHLRAEGLQYREIALVLGVSLGTVSASLNRSIARVTQAGAFS